MRDSERDERIDAIIDAAARSLTAVEPPAALRAGVRQRISRRNSVGWLVPVSVTAAVITVTIAGRALLGPPHESPRVRPTDVRLSIDRASTQRVSATGGPDKARPTGALIAKRPVAETFEPPPIEELEPAIPPLSIPPLETKLIAVEASSGMMPIEIEPLRIEPLQGE